MSAHFQSSGPRGNAYSESKFTNWTVYDPFFAECRAVFKQYDARISKSPKFPHIIAVKPQLSEFIHPCKRADIRAKLKQMPASSYEGLRAVFILSGTRKQQTSWRSKLGCYGMYWNSCVFLFPYLYLHTWYHYTFDDLRQFYLNDVLVHEIAHHIDRNRIAPKDKSEGFANAYVQEHLHS